MDKMSLTKQFADTLECPVCMSVYTPPVYLCSSGHSICSLCSSITQNCPFCNSSISNKTRNIVIENMLDQILVPCKFEGCGEMISLLNMPQHCKTCSYNNFIKCLECKSNEEDLIDHLIRKHEYKEIIMDEEGGLRSFSGPIDSWYGNTDWPKGIWRIGHDPFIVLAKCFANMFHVYLYRISRNPIRISMRIEGPGYLAKFKGIVPHISDYEERSLKPHFNCYNKVLLKNFVKVHDEDEEILRLWIRVIKKVDRSKTELIG
ncbi:unnamed protein product [Blepharisma stoltei]|uniref:RING-type domain-containing protein n=1 Tax=Blepharisma stoltei TaxID=1481888 RepID=A0AAU9IL47_9CILI|nr:unnamed protein product [Blepharisma stoltei]